MEKLKTSEVLQAHIDKLASIEASIRAEHQQLNNIEAQALPLLAQRVKLIKRMRADLESRIDQILSQEAAREIPSIPNLTVEVFA